MRIFFNLSGKYALIGLFLLFFSCKKEDDGEVAEVYPDDLPVVQEITFTNLLGCFSSGIEEKTATIPAQYDEIDKPIMTATVRVVIDPSILVAQVSKYIYGNNVNQYCGKLNIETKLVGYLNILKPHILRYPGGLHSNEFFWNSDTRANLPDDLPEKLLDYARKEYDPYWCVGINGDSWNFGINSFYELLKKTNCEAVMTVNYSYARYGTGPAPVQTAAHLAAEWVRYDYKKTLEMGIQPTRYWEIGNENCASWASGYYINKSLNQDGQPEMITPELYGQHLTVFTDSMRKAAAESGHTIYIGSQNDIGVFAGAGNAPDWMVDHTYFTPYQQNSSAKTILNSVVDEMPEYPEKTKTETSKYGLPMKAYTLTEWNIFAEGSGQNTSYINGMHAVMVLGEMIKNQYGMGNRWDIVNGWTSTGDDMGMFSLGTDPDGPTAKWNPRAIFYYMYYFQEFFGDKMVNYAIDSTGSDILVYPSSFSSGELGIILLNKELDEQIVQFYFRNFAPGGRYYYYSLTGGNERAAESLRAAEMSRQVFMNGIGPSTIVGGPADSFQTIHPYSSTMTNTFKVISPARSVQYILMEKKKND
ncbi:MAG TPA: hypothetical protein VJ346_11105 [Bacteroidales bacterium]|nr:hypothetical protein [Bacteroidales bacterium]